MLRFSLSADQLVLTSSGLCLVCCSTGHVRVRVPQGYDVKPPFQAIRWIEPATGKIVREESAVGCVTFSDDGRFAAADQSFGNRIRILDTDTWNVVADVNGSAFGPIAFAPDGKEFAAPNRTTIERWSLPGGIPQQHLDRNAGCVYSLRYAQSGRWLVLGGEGSRVVLWDRTRRLNRTEIEIGHLPPERFLALPSPDGRRLAVLQKAGGILDLETGRQCMLRGFKSEIGQARFSPDGRLLLTGTSDGLVRLWNPLSGDCLRQYDWRIGPIWELSLSPDGLTCAAGGENGQVVVWDVDA
jgi:WD40 repeat protein